MKLFIFAGQSNCMGYGSRLDLAPTPSWHTPVDPVLVSEQQTKPTLANSPCLYAEYYGQTLANTWGNYIGETPLSTGTQERNAFGFEVSFLMKYIEEHPNEQIAVLKVAEGGTSIEEWLNPSSIIRSRFNQYLSEAQGRLSGETIEYAGFIWHQGENGAAHVWNYQNNPNLYSTQLRQFISEIRGLTDVNMPVVIARIGNHMLTNEVCENDPLKIEATENRRSQQVIVGGDQNNIWFDTDNLPIDQSNSNPAYWFHHTGGGYYQMGLIGYSAWQQLVGETPPPPPTPFQLIIRQNGQVIHDGDGQVKLNGQDIHGDDIVIEVDY